MNNGTHKKGKPHTSDLQLPEILTNNKLNLNLQNDIALARQLTNIHYYIGPLAREKHIKTKRQNTCYGELPNITPATNTRLFPNRKTERDKRWPLSGWDADDTADDGKTILILPTLDL